MANPFSNLLKQAKQAQESIGNIKQELEAVVINAEAGAGMVKITADGNGTVHKVIIDPSVLGMGTQVVEELITAAINAMQTKCEQAKMQKMSEKIPGFGTLANFMTGDK